MKSPRSKFAMIASAALAALVIAVGHETVPHEGLHQAHAAPAMQGTSQTPPPTPATWDFNEYITSAPFPLTSHTAPSNGARTSNLGIFTHSRDHNTWQGLEPMSDIHHGPACESPNSTTAPTHASTNPMKYEDAVFICSGNPHVMTAMKASGYGVIYLTPAAMIDFANGPQTISFEVSTWFGSSRDWIDVWITPYDNNLVGPLDDWLPDLAGYPERSVQIKAQNPGSLISQMTAPNGSGGIASHDINDNWWLNYSTVITQSKSVRSKFRITLSQTHLKVDLLDSATGQPVMTFTDADLPVPLDWSRGVVQFGHHSYNPEKDCDVANPSGPDGQCKANTWHWDNLTLSNAVPFTQIDANERFMVAGTKGEAMSFTFPKPAPQDAHLRVNAVGDGYQYSTDNGSTWTPMTRQKATKNGLTTGNSMESYWQPIPAGVTSVKIRATQTGWWTYEAIDHVSIWSQQQQPASPPTPTAPPATSTPFPTAAPTNTPVFTPTALPTSTPVPPTSTATQIPTATPVPQGAIRINAGGPQFTDGSSNVWAADTGFTGGTASGTAGAFAVDGTTDDDLYIYRRFDPSFSYALTVPNGVYDVSLGFVENGTGGNGTRVFDVTAEGATIIDDLDINATVGWRVAHNVTTVVTVSDGTLNLAFTASVGNATVSAISVVQHVPPTPTPVPPTATATPAPCYPAYFQGDDPTVKKDTATRACP